MSARVDMPGRRSSDVDRIRTEFAERDAVQERDDVVSLVKLPAFRRFLAAIHGRARLAKVTYDGSGLSPMQLGYVNGRKEMAKEILAVVDRHAPEGYWLALTERRELELERSRRVAAAANGREQP